MFPLVPTVTVPLVGCVEMTIEPALIAAEPAISFAARFTVVEAFRTTEKLSAVAVGGVGTAVTVTWTLAGVEVKPLMSLIV